MTAKDIREFQQYLNHCTDRQVQGVYEKEAGAGREDYAELAYLELIRRGLAPEHD